MSEKSFYSQIRYLGLVTTIPAILLTGPACGYFIGRWLDQKFHFAPWMAVLFSCLGFAASVKEMTKIVKRVSESENSKKGDDEL